jgi:hypothetical protein
MVSMGLFIERLQFAIDNSYQMGFEAAKKVYIELGTVENAKQCFEEAVRGNHKDVVDFFMDHKKRDCEKTTPIELRNINWRKLLDEITHENVERIYVPKDKQKSDNDMKIYTPKKKNLTGAKDTGSIEKGEIKNG